MATHVVEGNGPPTDPPPSQGAHYVDLLTGDVYLASGTTDASDWGDPVGSGSGSGSATFNGQIAVEVDNLRMVGITANGFQTMKSSANPRDVMTNQGSTFRARGRLLVAGNA